MNYSARSLFACCCLALQVAMPSSAAETQQTAQSRPYLLRGNEGRLLESMQRFVDAEQWDEAIDVALRLQDSESDGFVARDIVARGEELYVGLRETVHQTIAQMPPTALSRYRGLVDPTAEAWCRNGIADRDVARLQRVIDQLFCSSWGDDALLALGELALEQGDYSLARRYWIQLSPALAGESLAYPDSDVRLSDLLARLVLVSIREGDGRRARHELEQLKTDHPDAKGRLGGREVLYADHLARLLPQPRQNPPFNQGANWPTFAGSFARTATRKAPIDADYEQQWSQPLGIAGTWPSVYPIVVGERIVYQVGGALAAVELATGEPAFASRGATFASVLAADQIGPLTSTLSSAGARVFGVVDASRLSQQRPTRLGIVWGVDLKREGALDFRWESEGANGTFDGAPVLLGTKLLVTTRSNRQSAFVGIACYDFGLRKLCWRRRLCQDDSLHHRMKRAGSQDLLTLDAGIVYTCPNSGIIAALRAEDGRLLWLRSYEQSFELSASIVHPPRSPSAAIYAHGRLYVRPEDGLEPEVLALDALTGAVRWRQAVSDSAARIVGLIENRLLVADGGLRLLDVETGEVGAVNRELPLTGTPVALGDTIYWPSNETIYALDGATAKASRPAIPLPESGGANLAVAGPYLIAAGPTQLTVFRAAPIADQVSKLP